MALDATALGAALYAARVAPLEVLWSAQLASLPVDAKPAAQAAYAQARAVLQVQCTGEASAIVSHFTANGSAAVAANAFGAGVPAAPVSVPIA